MKQIILMAATALFASTNLMAQNTSVTLRSAFDLPAFLTASPDSTIHYDENDKKSTKEENVFNDKNFVTQTNHYTWEEATSSWKTAGKPSTRSTVKDVQQRLSVILPTERKPTRQI